MRTSMSKSVRFYCDSGSHEIPVIGLNDDGEAVVVGKTDLFAEIQTHKDDVALDKIIARCSVTGENYSAPLDAFGDTTLFPKDLLEVKQLEQNVHNFTSSLSDEDLRFLLEKGFDDFVKMKIDSIKEDKKDEQ